MNDRVPMTPPKQPLRVQLATRDEVDGVCLALLDVAQRTVRCLHRNLAVFELARPATIERLHRFLRGHHAARVQLLVDDAAWLERDAARLKLLQRQFSHAIEIRVANPEDPVGDDAVLLIDDQHSLVLARAAHAIGELWFGNAPHAQPLVAAFERRWEAAAHNLAVYPLGL